MNENRLPISVFIIAKNEEDRISAAIKSVRDWVDEVIVIDSGSTDSTVEMCAALGATTIFHDWQGYGPQKVFGESRCASNWVLNIDADEQISEELQHEITALFASGTPNHTAYRLPIQPVYPSQISGHPWTITNYPVRLYRKDRAGFRDHPVHDAVIVHTGTTDTLSAPVHHRSFRDLAHHVEKVNSYSSAQAEVLSGERGKPSWIKILLVPPLAFLKSYFIRREFVNGVDGLVISYMYAFQRFIRIAKARELYQQHKRNRNPPAP